MNPTEQGKLKFVLYANPAFAIPSFELIRQSNYQILAVVTSPDRPAGRGLSMKKPEIKVWAENHHLPVLQPESLNDEGFIRTLNKLNPNIQIVIAFHKIPTEVWKLPEFGTINLHPSLLPQYRGAAPINWTLINGEKTTGITTIFINDVYDSGDIIFQEQVPVLDTDTAGSLHDRLSELGAQLVLRTIRSIEDHSVSFSRQPFPPGLKKAPKLKKETCRINWDQDTEVLYNFIRGLSPYPAAWTTFENKMIRIYNSQRIPGEHLLKPGQIQTDNKKFLYTGTGNGILSLTEIQMEGRKVMPVSEFLKGFKFNQESFFI